MTDPTDALAELRDWWKSLTDEERWDAFVIEKGNADGLAARPVSGPIHYPECNERCVHYLLGSDDSPTDVSVLGRPSAPEGESGDLGRLRGRGPARPVSGVEALADRLTRYECSDWPGVDLVILDEVRAALSEDHATPGFVRCPLCGEPERTEDIVGGVCLTCGDAIAFSQNARRGAIVVAATPSAIPVEDHTITPKDARPVSELQARLERFIDYRSGTPQYVTANGIRQDMPQRFHADARALRAALSPTPEAEK